MFILLHNVVLKDGMFKKSMKNSKYPVIKGENGSSLCQSQLWGFFISLIQICGSLSSTSQSLTYSHPVFCKIWMLSVGSEKQEYKLPVIPSFKINGLPYANLHVSKALLGFYVHVFKGTNKKQASCY